MTMRLLNSVVLAVFFGSAAVTRRNFPSSLLAESAINNFSSVASLPTFFAATFFFSTHKFASITASSISPRPSIETRRSVLPDEKPEKSFRRKKVKAVTISSIIFAAVLLVAIIGLLAAKKTRKTSATGTEGEKPAVLETPEVIPPKILEEAETLRKEYIKKVKEQATNVEEEPTKKISPKVWDILLFSRIQCELELSTMENREKASKILKKHEKTLKKFDSDLRPLKDGSKTNDPLLDQMFLDYIDEVGHYLEEVVVAMGESAYVDLFFFSEEGGKALKGKELIKDKDAPEGSNLQTPLLLEDLAYVRKSIERFIPGLSNERKICAENAVAAIEESEKFLRETESKYNELPDTPEKAKEKSFAWSNYKMNSRGAISDIEEGAKTIREMVLTDEQYKKKYNIK